MEVRFTGRAWHFITENGGVIQITAKETKASCCGSILIPYVALGGSEDQEFRQQSFNGIMVYVHRSIKARQDLRVRLDTVWQRPRLVAEWV